MTCYDVNLLEGEDVTDVTGDNNVSASGLWLIEIKSKLEFNPLFKDTLRKI